MSEIKTKPTDLSINEFLMNIEPEKRKLDCMELRRFLIAYWMKSRFFGITI